MATYLFAWNPTHWNWPELPQRVRKAARSGHVDVEWSSGRVRAIEPGSRAFMIRLGVPPKGIIGAGYVVTAPVAGEHWVAAKAKAGIPGLYLKLRFEVLRETPLVTFDDLAVSPFSRFRWGIRQSGTRVPSSLAEALEALWEARLREAKAAPALSDSATKAAPVPTMAKATAAQAVLRPATNAALKDGRSGSRHRGRRG